MSEVSGGFIFPRKGKNKPQRKQDHIGRVLVANSTVYSKWMDKHYRYIDIRVGLDILERVGFEEGMRLQFGMNPKSLQAVVVPCEKPDGYPVVIHAKRNKSVLVRIPEAELPCKVGPDTEPMDVGFMVGKITMTGEPGVMIELHKLFNPLSTEPPASPDDNGPLYLDGRRYL